MRDDVVRVDGFEIEKSCVKFVESELRRHPGRKKRLNVLIEQTSRTELDTILATPASDPGMPRAPGVGNPTASRAVAVIDQARKIRERDGLSMEVNRIQGVFNALPKEQQQAIEAMFFDGRYTREGAADKLGIDAKTLRLRLNRSMIPFVQVIFGDHRVVDIGA